MQFVHPNFLWALSLVALPIIIHLFHFRRYKKVNFTNVAFLKELQKETRSYQKLRNLLVLITRIFAVVFLVLAFAQPYIPASENTRLSESEDVYLYIDNSFSMDALSSQGPVLEGAKETARSIIKAYGNSQKFEIISNARDYSSSALNKDDALAALDEIESSPFQLSKEELLKTVNYRIQKSAADRHRLYWISDFQAPNREEEQDIALDSNTVIHMIPLQVQQRSNLAIDSVWMEDPVVQINKALNLMVSVHNYGQSDIEAASINLIVNGRNNSVVGFDLAAGAKSTLNLNFIPSSGGWKEIELRIEDKSIIFDDSYFTAINVKSSVEILEIAGPETNSSIGSLFSTDPYFKHTKVDEGNIEIATFSKLDFIVLNELENIGSGLAENIKEFCDQGGSLLIIPSRKSEQGDVNNLSSRLNLPNYDQLESNTLKVTQLALADPLLDKVFDKVPSNPDFPVADKYFTFSGNTEGAIPLMMLSGSKPFLQYQNIGQGKAFQLAVPLNPEFSNFHKHALFVPLVLKMAFNRSIDFPLSYTLKRTLPMVKGVAELGQLQSEIEVKNENGSWIPVVQAQGGRTLIDLGDDLEKSGFYRINHNDSLIQSIALNYSRDESSSKFFGLDDIKNSVRGATVELWEDNSVPVAHRIEEIQFGKRFWKTCVVLVLIFLAIEILLLRFWRNKRTDNTVETL